MAKLTATVNDVVMFKSLFGLLCRNSDMLKFKVDKEGISSVTMPADMATFLSVLIKPNFFEEWNFEGSFMYCYFDPQQFSRMMKNLTSKKIEMVLDENYINFSLENEGRKKHISLVQITGELSELPGNLGTDFDFSWIIEIETLKSIVDDIVNVDDNADLSSIYFTWEKDSLKVEARESKVMKFETIIGPPFVKCGSGHSSFRTNYFSKIVWAGLGKIRFSILNTDGPAFMETCDDSKFSLKFIVAPFVASNPDMDITSENDGKSSQDSEVVSDG